MFLVSGMRIEIVRHSDEFYEVRVLHSKADILCGKLSVRDGELHARRVGFFYFDERIARYRLSGGYNYDSTPTEVDSRSSSCGYLSISAASRSAKNRKIKVKI